MGTEVPETIKVCTVVIKDDAGRVLTVRKRGTNALMLPGGKPEQGESVKDTAAREVAEELGVALDLKVLHELIKLPPERRTVRLTMHSSSQKNVWNKITSAKGLLPRRGA